MATILSAVGGVLVGYVCMSFAIEHSFKDYRPWLCFVGFCMAIVGVGL